MPSSINYDQDERCLRLIKANNSWENPKTAKKVYRNISYSEYENLLSAQTMHYNKKREKVVVTPRYVDHIQIIDLDGKDDMVLSTAESDAWPTTRYQSYSGALKIFYGTTRITDDHILVKYVNRTISELTDTPEETEIHVFDWNGDAVARLRFEDPIASFAVDAKNNMLYGIDNMSRVYTYDLSSCL